MEKYDRGNIVDEEMAILFPQELLIDNIATVKVKAGSKITNLLNFALPAIKEHAQVIVAADGPAVTKAVTVAEIIKRRQNGLYQWNKIGYKKVLEYWEPNEEGLTRLKVTREIPAIHILLSKTPLDTSLPGVQQPAQRSRPPRPRPRNSDSKDAGPAPSGDGSGPSRRGQHQSSPKTPQTAGRGRGRGQSHRGARSKRGRPEDKPAEHQDHVQK